MSSGDLPSDFLARLSALVGPEHFDRCLKSFATPKATTFRVNTLLAPISEVCERLAEAGIQFAPIEWCESAFRVPSDFRDSLVASETFLQRHIYVQNASSLVPVVVLDPQPGETVLDLAAAPGGKTLHIAARMGNQGTLSAVEAIRSRFYKLQNNLRQHGASMVKTYLTDGRSVGHKTPERFDRVLLDAPCSAESRIRIDNPESWKYWSLRKIREQARKQTGLLKSAVRALKPGGRLVYCTCSFSPEENELVIQKQLEREGDTIEILPIELVSDSTIPGLTSWNGSSLHPSLRLTRHILPSETWDGFFIAKIEKRC